MAEYIERENLLKRFNIDDMMNVNRTLISLREARETISNFPAADVVPVRHGRWALNKKYGDYECSECGQGDVKVMDFTNLKMRYCPNCGARMDGAE
nr:MAG TPA: LysW biosynthesis protein LysW [Caudoviricetes sp.]